MEGNEETCLLEILMIYFSLLRGLNEVMIIEMVPVLVTDDKL